MVFTITLPDTMTVAMRNGASVELPIKDLPVAMIENGATLGLMQKVRNFAASALMNCKVTAAGDKRNDETDAAYDKRVGAMVVSTEDLFAESVACMEAGVKRLVAGDWTLERAVAGTSIAKGFADFVIAKHLAIFEAQMEGFKGAKVPERRVLIADWLDAKEGRKEKYAAEWEAEQAKAAREARSVDLDDL